MINNIWTGRKVRLRPVVSADWSKFHQNDADTEGARHGEAIYFPRSEAGTRSWVEVQANKGPNGDKMMFAVESLQGELVGSITTHNCNARNGTFKYGVAIFREHWRQGYASDAIRVLVRYFFEELRYQKATAHVYAFNESSIALHERLGFIQEGRLRSMIYTGGMYHDELLYGLTRTEYAKWEL